MSGNSPLRIYSGKTRQCVDSPSSTIEIWLALTKIEIFSLTRVGRVHYVTLSDLSPPQTAVLALGFSTRGVFLPSWKVSFKADTPSSSLPTQTGKSWNDIFRGTDTDCHGKKLVTKTRASSPRWFNKRVLSPFLRVHGANRFVAYNVNYTPE